MAAILPIRRKTLSNQSINQFYRSSVKMASMICSSAVPTLNFLWPERYRSVPKRKCVGLFQVHAWLDTSYLCSKLSDTFPVRNSISEFFIYIISSPELKAQVSFSDHLSSVVCLSVRPSVCLSVNFSPFHLLLQNHWANFNQTWHKASLRDGGSSLFKWRAPPFSKGR